MSFSKWKEVELGEILNFRRGHDLPKKSMIEGRYPVAGSNGIIGYHNEFTTKKPCITIGRSGNVGTPFFYNTDCWAHNTTLYIDDFKGNHAKYIYYLLKVLNLGHYAGGSAVPTLNRNHIHPIKVKIPSTIEEQKAIANILSTLDDKIEVNNKINEKLEEMSQSIFKQWFVDFDFPNMEGKPYKSSGGEMVESELGIIPKDWEVCEIKSIVDNIKESTKPGIHLKDKKYVPIDCMSMKSITLNSYKSYEEAKSSLILFNKYDILIGAMRVYFHRVNLAPFDGVTRTTTFVLRPKNKYDLAYSLFLLNLESTISYANSTSKGSTMPYAVWENGLENMKIVLPDIKLRSEFNKVIMPILNKTISLSKENNKLIRLRDTLLPKLMSGEIRVLVEK